MSNPKNLNPQGKLETEDLLQRSGVNYTSIRPVYIYGPLNYNPVEEFFFHRIKAGRPICVPGSGMQVMISKNSAARMIGQSTKPCQDGFPACAVGLCLYNASCVK